MVALVEKGARGTFHACGRGEASRFDLTRETIAAAGLNVAVEPITSDQLPHAAPRPRRAVLSCVKLERATGMRFPPWQDSVRTYLTSKT